MLTLSHGVAQRARFFNVRAHATLLKLIYERKSRWYAHDELRERTRARRKGIS